MQITKNKKELLASLADLPRPLALVPTMGCLHAGHLSLIELAKPYTKSVAATIFVNPKQFNDPKDFTSYPTDIQDRHKLSASGVDLLFAPDAKEIYPDGNQTMVEVSELSSTLEGAFRPGHFQGVCQIISILFNLFRPEYAVFGEKDFQQLRIIEQLTQDMHYSTEILRAPIVREASGLAMSSRNELLSTENRAKAAVISETLQLAQETAKNRNYSNIIVEICQKNLSRVPELETEYLMIADENTLQPCNEANNNSRMFYAGYIGGVRLIDNCALSET